MNSLQWHLNKYGLSNVLLSDLLKNANIGKSLFKGIYPVDGIPKRISAHKNFIIIINIGLHFVTLYAKPKVLIYIDSFGQKPPSSLHSFLQSCKQKSVVYNKKQIQSLESTHCGLYAVLYVLLFNAKKSGKKCKSIKFNGNNLLKNDDICIRHIKYYVSLFV